MSDPLASPVPVSGPDAEILRYLTQVVAIGQHKGTWDAAAVHRVAEAHLRHPHTLRRQLLNERAARGRAEEELERLRAKVRQLTAMQGAPVATESPLPSRVVELSPKRYAVLELMVAGYSRQQIADKLGLSRDCAADRIRRVIADLDATGTAQVIQLVRSRQVEVRVAAAGERAA